MWIRKTPNRQRLDVFSASGQTAPQFILIQTLPNRIHRLGRVCLRQLGEASNLIGDLHENFHHLRIKVRS